MTEAQFELFLAAFREQYQELRPWLALRDVHFW